MGKNVTLSSKIFFSHSELKRDFILVMLDIESNMHKQRYRQLKIIRIKFRIPSTRVLDGSHYGWNINLQIFKTQFKTQFRLIHTYRATHNREGSYQDRANARRSRFRRAIPRKFPGSV